MRSRYDDELVHKLRLAILFGMLLEEYQDTIMQMSCGRDLKYAPVRGPVLNLATQNEQMLKPVPMDG